MKSTQEFWENKGKIRKNEVKEMHKNFSFEKKKIKTLKKLQKVAWLMCSRFLMTHRYQD